MTATANASRRLIDTTIDAEALTRMGGGWQARLVLARQIADITPLSTRQIDTLLAAIRSGLPVTLKTRNYVAGPVVETATVVVTALRNVCHVPSQRISKRQWGGFNGDVYLSDIVDVTTPDTACEAADK
ncbi:hypothetical protein DS6A_9 [Mycobacterium phage DS6A]|uniref:Uncharacterized protein n=1 Tax=Mycobacterium phage DS6A TaxID=45764 RepID=G8I4B9_9CAUD|nr:hypothetical protein DS6A_9 [Mycobacterium phage DS6A]AER47563.1 hypothetical protein DS6A_9 [Mycobacterium phage DS6A]